MIGVMKMNINLNLHKGFADCINKMVKKYGEKFSLMNGFSNSNLNFTDFIDNFIKSSSVADTTIDANANSTTLDVRTLLSDMVKPHTKLLSYNKIFGELSAKYGSELAEKWLEGEWNGQFYLHNSSTASGVSHAGTGLNRIDLFPVESSSSIILSDTLYFPPVSAPSN